MFIESIIDLKKTSIIFPWNPETPSLQEELGTIVSPSGIAKELDVSQTSVRQMVKRKGYKNFKRMKTPKFMNDGTLRKEIFAEEIFADFGPIRKIKFREIWFF